MLLNSSLTVNISATITLNFDSVEIPSKVVTVNYGDILTYTYFNTDTSLIETVTGEVKGIILFRPAPTREPFPMERLGTTENYIESIRFIIDASTQYESKVYKILAKDILDIILPETPVAEEPITDPLPEEDPGTIA